MTFYCFAITLNPYPNEMVLVDWNYAYLSVLFFLKFTKSDPFIQVFISFLYAPFELFIFHDFLLSSFLFY